MDDIDNELVSLPCTKVGMLMGDHSAIALTIGGLKKDEQKKAINELAHSVTKIAKLAAAAQSIAE